MINKTIFMQILKKSTEILMNSIFWAFILLIFVDLKAYQYFFCGISIYFIIEEFDDKIKQYLMIRGLK